MRFIPTKVHGILDYLMAILLMASPWIFGLAEFVYQPTWFWEYWQ